MWIITEINGKRKKRKQRKVGRWKEGRNEGRRRNRADEMISSGSELSICDRRRDKDRRRVIKDARTSDNRHKVV